MEIQSLNILGTCTTLPSHLRRTCMMTDLHQWVMLGPIQPELCHWIRRCKYVTLTHKIIDDLQFKNSNLMRRVKELEWNPCPSEEEEQSTTKGNTVDT